MLLDTVTPLALQVALTVADELTNRAAEADAIRATHVQRAQHAADTARRRYLTVDPTNRLVAEALEADWNAKLRELSAARDDYEHARTREQNILTDAQRERIRALATNFPALWHDPATPQRERKRLLRLLVNDVTLIKTTDGITAHVRLRGGQDHTLDLPLPQNSWQQRKTKDSTVDMIDRLLDDHTYHQVAGILNQQCLTTGDGRPFTAERLHALCFTRNIPSRWQRLRDAGMLTLDEIAKQLHAHPSSIKRWYRLGLITGALADDRGTCLYQPDQTRPSPTLVEATGKAVGDDQRSGRSYHPSLCGPLTTGRACRTPVKKTTPPAQVSPATIMGPP